MHRNGSTAEGVSRRRVLALPLLAVSSTGYATTPGADDDLLSLMRQVATTDLRQRGLESMATQYDSIASAARRLRAIELGDVPPMCTTVVGTEP